MRSNDLNPISDVTMEVKKRKEKGERSLIVTLTIKDAENLTDYLKIKALKWLIYNMKFKQWKDLKLYIN